MIRIKKLLWSLAAFYLIVWEGPGYAWTAHAQEQADQAKTHAPVLLQAEFIFPPETRPTPTCHASTVAALPDGSIVAAWFGGTAERNPDTGIWMARREAAKWTHPEEVATGVQPDGTRLPCWNPVLFQPAHGPLMLFFKVGPTPAEWWGEMMVSDNEGKTWRDRKRLPAHGIGPVKNKPVETADGTILCPSSDESGGRWRVHLELTRDLGRTWAKLAPLTGDETCPAIQPAILRHPDGKLQLLCRTRQRGVLATSWSSNNGQTWSPLAATAVPNPNAGIDAVTLQDGQHLLVYNPRTNRRSLLAVASSSDGLTWRRVLTLDDEPGGEFSYPAIIQAGDGRVHITYTWKRKLIRHVVLAPGK